MPRLQFGTSAFERARGDLPKLPVVNMFAEQAPTEETGVVLQSRPGLAAYITMGDGPIRQIFSANGVLDGGFYGVSDDKLYAGTTLLGTIDGDDYVSMAGYSNLLFVAAGAQLWTWDMATLSAVPFPDSADVKKVITGASRAICLRADTQKFYWSDPLSDTIDALAFASAESQPDASRDILFLNDTLINFGAETVEFWPNTGDATLPFQPVEGRTIEKGVKATGCAVKFMDTFAWITNFNQVCLGVEGKIISNPDLEEKIGPMLSPRLWTFYIEGLEFLAVRVDGETWVYGARSGTWSQMETYGLDNWGVQCFMRSYFGDAVGNKLYRFDYDSHVDEGGVMERRFRAGLPITSGSVPVNNMVLRTNPGATPYLTGDYVEPTVQMRLSRDAGRTWGNWRSTSLGRQGEYRKRVQWAGCGRFGQPGILAEFRVTDPVDFRVSDVRINEVVGAP